MNFLDKLRHRINSIGSNLCVGLDLRAEHADADLEASALRLIEETAPYAAAFKPNSAYFEALGWRGMKLLETLRAAIPSEIPVVLDGKRGDIGETQAYYAKAAFEWLQVDAVTLNPYMGRDTLEPFLAYAEKGIYLLGVTSNPGAADIEMQTLADGQRAVFELVTEMTELGTQVGLVVGLTQAESVLPRIPDVPLLIPGLGAQGGDLAALRSGQRQAPQLINVSRGILHGSADQSFAERAQIWQQRIRNFDAQG